MALGIGIDIGSVSVKAAVAGSSADSALFTALVERAGFRLIDTTGDGILVAVSPYLRIKGRPIETAESLLARITGALGGVAVPVRLTGAGARFAARLADRGIDAAPVNEFTAIVDAVSLCHPEARTVFEMGGESSKYILLEQDPHHRRLALVDYGTNGDCAAGTGAFMDQQAGRLKYAIEDVGGLVVKAGKVAQIAGRCSVFAKSDMIHAQQRGYQPDEVLKGLCNAVARNFKSAICRGRKVVPPVLMVGGVALNAGMLQSLREVFELNTGDLVVPEQMCWFGAIGAALKARDSVAAGGLKAAGDSATGDGFTTVAPLVMDMVTELREQAETFTFPKTGERVPAWLGVDVGSVSTNLVVIDADGRVIKEIYTRTNARPIEVVGEGLREIEREIGDRIGIRGVGATGSGRELIGILIGADTINDEITAHKTGALHISRGMLGREVDTIFEIGGQDSKFIAIEDGIVVDFTMNDACAAGTGSFLEEQADDLGVNIKGEFAEIALSSSRPIRMGERCTVFMGRDVHTSMQRGARKEDVIAGLAYSVVLNYLNRVVRGRRIGDTIFFQGGTAYNDAVAAAFARITGKQIIVPPHNGVMGAIGAALIARDRTEKSGHPSKFKGFDLSKVDYHLREFTCRGCSNFCTVQEFTVDGEKTYWGDKCSEKYRKQKKIDRTPVIDDLARLRDILLRKSLEENDGGGPVVGIPLAMYTYDRLPFFAAYLAGCGFSPVVSDQTNTAIANKGVESVVAEPCYPVTVAHGHVKHLLDEGVDHIWLPNMINSETDTPEVESHVCVWGSTLPFVVSHAPGLGAHRHRFITPTLHFRDGGKVVKRELHESVKHLGVSRAQSDAAYEKAAAAQEKFRADVLEAGRRAVGTIRESGERAIVMVGRPYNIYDRATNLSVASKLAAIYGINVIPLDFIPAGGTDISGVNDNMFWNYGKKILQTAVSLASEPQFDIIYITNFKCGPDSFIKQYIRDAIGRPFLVLQFDGHSNDAGMMTRCEAYLDSKGFLAV